MSTLQVGTISEKVTDAGVAVDGVTLKDGDVTIADKIIHDGDTNTAIRFPSADTVTIETGGSEGFRVDANGVVATPKIPMMLAQGSRTFVGTGVTDYSFVAIPERYDVTNSYDPSTGVFTAPVAGKYFVFAHFDLSSSQTNAHISVSVNSSTSGGGGGYDTNNAWQIQTGDHLQWTGMVNVSANDTIRMLVYPDAVKNAFDAGTNRHHIIMYLVG